MAAEDHKTLHIVMFPWLAFGHILPYLELSKLIAQNGHKISFVSTPRNIDRLPKLPPNLASLLTFIKIPLPKLPELPEYAEATTDIDGGLTDHLKIAFDGMETGLTRFLDSARPDWIISDFAPHWLPPVAARLDIPMAFYYITNAWFLAFLEPAAAMITGPLYRTKPEDYTVPPKWVDFYTTVAYRGFEANDFAMAAKKNNSGFSDFFRAGKVIMGSRAILVRHCYEFEPQWLTVLEAVQSKPVVPVGLLPPAVEDHDRDRAEEVDPNWVLIRKWLDQQKSESVVYVALGSEVRPSGDQLSELAHGLELSGVPFLLNLRHATGLPEGFEERVSGRGMVWRSWAPQMKILSHDSVGGFLTHCGWSSIIEGLMFGLPLIGLPVFVDQGLNARVVGEREIGVEIARNEEDGSYTRNSVADSVKLVMMEDDGKKMRERAKEMAALFGDRELQIKYIDNLLDFLVNNLNSVP